MQIKIINTNHSKKKKGDCKIIIQAKSIIQFFLNSNHANSVKKDLAGCGEKQKNKKGGEKKGSQKSLVIINIG